MTGPDGGFPVSRADEARAVEWSARAGYLAKGAVYALVGAIALDAVLGAGPVRGVRGAIDSLRDEAFGMVLIGLTGLGLLGYAFYRLYSAVKDVEGRGTDAKGIAIRAGMAVTGIIYGSLSFYTLSLLFGGGGGGGGGGVGSSGWTAAVAGAAVLVFGGVELYRAWSEQFLSSWRIGEMSATERRWGTRFGKAGLTARGVVFLVLGGLFLSNAARGGGSPGMRDALVTLSQQDFGPWLLGFVAVGLIAYGMFCVVDARYRRVQV